MMMNKIKTTTISLIILVASAGLFGQESSKDSLLLEARILLNDYRDASKFRNESTGKFDPSWENIFINCFDTLTRKIIFDVPISEKVHKSKTGEGKKEIIELSKIYLEYVSLNQYIDTIRSLYERYDSINFNYRFIESGNDFSNNRMTIEIEKQFVKTGWSLPESKKYMFEIKFTNYGPKITSIRLKDEDFAKTEVELMFIDNSIASKKGDVPGRGIADVVSRIKIDFDEDINDRMLTDKSDNKGKIKLGLVANRARIFIDTVYGANGVKYSIPTEWKLLGSVANQRQVGKRVNQQPVGGFKIPLQAYKWKGWSLTPLIYGGLLGHSPHQLDNFSGDADFTNKIGFKLGGGIDIAYYFNPDNWNDNSGNWIFGVGSGFSINYFRFNISSNGFNQIPYAYADQAGDTCQILVSGNAFNEVIGTTSISVPLYFEIKKKLKHKIYSMRAVSLQGGVNIMLPLNSSYNANGTFSRQGLYPEYNNQVITDDAFYNYYTNQQKSYTGQVNYQPIIAEGLIKLNGFFDVFNNNPDNTLNVGLQFSFPFTSATSSKPEDYLILNENDEYSSLAYSKNNIYDYYFGISVGINLVKYKVE